MSGSVCRGCGAGQGRCTYLSLILHVESDEGGGGHIPECLDLYAGVAVLGSCTYLSLILHVESDEGGGGHIPECLDLYAGVAVLDWAAVHTSVSSCM